MLCDKENISPALVICCDGHIDRDNERDSTIFGVLNAAGISFVRLQTKRSYEPQELLSIIRSEIGPLKNEIEL